MYNPLLDAFVRVAESGSFSKAAEQMFITSTAVMKQMNQLEAHLGMRLLERTNHGVRLTARGESIYKDARFLISYSQRAMENARRQELGTCSLTLCVATSLLNPSHVFMRLWGSLRDRFPHLRVHIAPYDDGYENLLSVIAGMGEKLDFWAGVCSCTMWQGRCGFLPLGTYRRCLAMPVNHRLAGNASVSLDDLHGETLMLPPRGESPENDAVRREIERRHPQIHLEDAPFAYDISVFNQCEKNGWLLYSLDCWRDVHPSLMSVPIDWAPAATYGLLYPLDGDQDIQQIVAAIREMNAAQA